MRLLTRWYVYVEHLRGFSEHVLMFSAQTFRNPKPELLAILKESGPAEGANGTAAAKPPKRKPTTRNVDMEKLAEALPQLPEDDLLQIVQMVHDNKTEETYTKNDLESKLSHFHPILVSRIANIYVL
jgi:transcription initiation factor IIF auxiliary subunit